MRALVKNAVFDRVPGVLRRGPTGSRRIALTFDDGPGAMTGRLLDVLDELAVPATFFLLGGCVALRPEMVREYLRRGHQIASHGYDHARFTTLPRRDLLAQCRRTDELIGGQISGRPWVRPPHGALDATSLGTLLAAGYTIALWSLDSGDHVERTPGAIADRCAPDKVRGGEVVLLHEEQRWTLEALPRIVRSLQGAGLECVTMHDLFAT